MPYPVAASRNRNFGVPSFLGAYDAVPSIVAAYGMRRLRGAYTGSILRIRRSSDNAEQDIGALANGDLNTAAIATFVGGGSGYIVNWYDQSGNAYTASQTTAASQPLYVASGQNGRPVGRFDGANDFWILPVNDINVSNRTVISVYRKVNSGVLFASISGNEDIAPYSAFDFNDGNWYVADATGYWSATNDGSVGWRVVTDFVNGGASAGLFLNGNSIAVSSKILDSRDSTFTRIGKRFSNFINGDIAELIICNAALSDANRQAAEAAANAYWAVY